MRYLDEICGFLTYLKKSCRGFRFILFGSNDPVSDAIPVTSPPIIPESNIIRMACLM